MCRSEKYLWAEIVHAEPVIQDLLNECTQSTEIMTEDSLHLLVQSHVQKVSMGASNAAGAARSSTDESLSNSSSSDDDTSSVDDNIFVSSLTPAVPRKHSGMVNSDSMSFEDVFNEFTSDEDLSTPEVDLCYPAVVAAASSSSSSSNSSSNKQNKQHRELSTGPTQNDVMSSSTVYSFGNSNKQQVTASSAEDSWGWFLSTSLK
jgi:hypothetical protein